jgi:perosamine synthetase
MNTRYEIPLSSPDITDVEIDAVVNVMKTRHLSLGPELPAFENALAEKVGAKYAVAVNSGTSALHLCLLGCGVGEGDEVITSPFSFIASANAAFFVGAKPRFVDIDPDTLNMNVAHIEGAISSATKAILPVHVFGLPAEMDTVLACAETHELAVIEDSCEALGALYKGRHAGTIGDCGTFAFYPNKQITTGEGGIIVTDSEHIAERAVSLRNQGRDAGMGWLAHARLGYNYRLSDIQCAMGRVQIERLDEILQMRANVAGYYAEAFAEIAPMFVTPCQPEEGVTRSWFVYVVQLPSGFNEKQRNGLIAHLRERGIGSNCYFPPIHVQPFYRDMGYSPGDFPVTEDIGARSIALPFYNRMTRDGVQIVVKEVAMWLAAGAKEADTVFK